jgi:hypothetical protein
MRLFRNANLFLAASVLVAALGCTSSPTEPSSPPVTSKPPVPTTTYTVSVTANPPNITGGGTASSTVTVEVHRSDTGATPPDGSQVTLTTNLGTFNSTAGPQTVTLALVNGRAQAALFAGTEVGTAAVTATFSGGGTGAANVGIGAPATFFVSSVSPNLGDAAGGQTVTILGGGFAAPVRVTFGGAAATVRSVSPNQIVVVTPSAAAAGAPVGVGQTSTVTVVVTNHVNQVNELSDSIDRGFTYSLGGGPGGPPSVFSVNPASGGNEGGTRVVITGTGFVAPLQVLFGRGTSASNFDGVEGTVVSVTPTQIVALTPPARALGQNLTNQLVDVLVKEPGSGFSGVGSQQFKYGSKVQITAMGPGAGSYLGGTQVIIQGSGFEGPVAVTFHYTNPNVSVAQQVRSVSGNQIVIITSQAPLPTSCPTNGLIPSDSVTVVNTGTGDSDTANIGFNAEIPLPRINGFETDDDAGAVGDTITIRGSGFNQNTAVTFGSGTGGSSAHVIPGGTSTAIDVTVPQPPSGFTFKTRSCPNGGIMDIDTPITVTVTDSSTGCSSAFSNGFLLAPVDPSCRNTTPPTPPTASFTATPVTGHTIQFADTSTVSSGATIIRRLWTFENGFVTDDTNNPTPLHDYTSAGGPFPRNFSVTLKVFDSNGLSNQTVKVIAVP